MTIRLPAFHKKIGGAAIGKRAVSALYLNDNLEERTPSGDGSRDGGATTMGKEPHHVVASSPRARVMFIGRSTAHLSYFESILTALENRGAEVELLFDKRWSSKLPGTLGARLDEFRLEHPNLKTGWLSRRKDKWREFLFALRELRSYRSYITRRETTKFYIERWRNYLTPKLSKLIKNPLWVVFLKSGVAGFLLRAAEYLTPSDHGISAYLKQQNPDILIATPTNMRFSEETDYLKAAKHLGIPTAIPVLSWDNLSTKGLIQQKPDMIFVWNKAQYLDAMEIHKISPKKITISGAPFFDKWFDKSEEVKHREAFCQRVGLDPKRKILLYLGSSANIARDESWFIEEVIQCLKKSTDPQLSGAQILIRPHPANAKIYCRLSKRGFCVWPRDGALPETRKDFDEMRETFFHADAALSINTSGMVDAVLSDLPVATVRIKRYVETQSKSRHFRQLTDVGALYMAADLPEFEKILASLFAGNDPLSTNRHLFANAFARPCGVHRSAGDVIAETILNQVETRANV